jgi:hypothetical protein
MQFPSWLFVVGLGAHYRMTGRKRMWPFTSPRAKRISGPKNFRPSVKIAFFNTIGAKRTFVASKLSELVTDEARAAKRKRQFGFVVSGMD